MSLISDPNNAFSQTSNQDKKKKTSAAERIDFNDWLELLAKMVGAFCPLSLFFVYFLFFFFLG